MNKAHLQYSWWKYLVIAMVSVTVWMLVFDGLDAPKKNEKLRVTCVGDGFLCAELEAALVQELPGQTTQKIKKVAVESPINGQSRDYHSVMATRAYGADLIIVEESAMTEAFGQSYCVPLPVEKLPAYLTGVEYYTENDTVYGILLYDGSTPNAFSEFYSGGERCYVFITHTCVNAAGIMGNGKSGDDAALRAIALLLESK